MALDNLMKKNNSDTYKLTIDRFEEEKAILSDGQFECVIPKKLIPSKIKVGESIVLKMTPETEYVKKKEMLAKEILNEILGN